jgi:hypothetical protein
MVRIAPRPFPAPLASQLTAALSAEHARRPFSPIIPRDAAQRVASLATKFGLEATVYRGSLDVGAAELDHLWVVIADRVVDAAFPLRSPRFVAAIRAYVAGDLDDDTLERLAHPYSVTWRVVGEFPDDVSYVGRPVWGAGSRPALPRG